MNKLFLLLLTGITLSVCPVFAQSLADIQSPKIVSPAPEAAGLGKYAQIPIDKSTGVPNINIPLYEINTPRFKLPISLSYHASGIKVDETAGWVGIGWSLNAGGVISRSMVGLADDNPGGFLNQPAPPLAQSIFGNFHADSAVVQQMAHGLTDSEPDNFFYNFADQSGQFVFGTDKKPVITPYKPLNIAYTTGGYAILTFTVTDENGDRYIFNDRELSHSSSSDALTGTTSWYLSQMISADLSDTISFRYKNDPGIFVDNSYSFSQTIAGEPFAPQNITVWNMVPVVNTSNVQQIHLDTILFKGGMVTFIPKGGRLDIGYISLDSVIVSNYDYNRHQYNRIKSFKLQTDYFYSGLTNPTPYNFNTDDASKHRLRLSGISENDANSAAIKTYQFGYNPTQLPPVHNFGQDSWGYYNGKYFNPTLLPTQQIDAYDSYSNPIIYTIGGSGLGGDRSVSVANMQAGILNQITYPTKGYTQFNYESHQYLAPSSTSNTVSASSVGVMKDTSIVSFTPPSTGNFNFHIHITPNSNLSYSYVKILKASDHSLIYSYPGSSSLVDFDTFVALTGATPYLLMAVSRDDIDTALTPTVPVSAITTTYLVTGTPVATYVGGLRIKSIKNYDSNNALITQETYKYGTTGQSESGGGDFLTNTSFLSTRTEHLFQFPIQNYMNGTTIFYAGAQQSPGETFSSNTLYPLSTQNASPVGYESVTVYSGDTVNNIGKDIYQYNVTPDSVIFFQSPSSLTAQTAYSAAGNFNYGPAMAVPNASGVRPISVAWKNGEPTAELHYRNGGEGQYSLEKSKVTTYNLFYRPSGRGLSLQYFADFVDVNRNLYSPSLTLNVVSYDFIANDYPILSGVRVPAQTITTNYASDGTTQQSQDTIQYTYANTAHMYPTAITSYDGTGNTLLKTVQYPQDMVKAGLDPTGIYAAMVSANIISPVIRFTQSKNSTQLMQSLTTYASTGGIIKPQKVSLQVMANPAETRLNYNNYDNGGNLLSVNKPYGAQTSYIWGYNKSYPVAEVKNAPYNDIFYEGFEDGNANSSGSKTGQGGFIGNYSKALTGLDNGAYRLTYWLKIASAWALKDTTVSVTSGAFTITASGQLDDIRFYPAAAHMTTYTYDPLIGLTSTTDEKGKVLYYEYDYMQRLMNIRDQYHNIVKSFCYNYAGQAAGCYIDLPSYKNAPQSAAFPKSCTTGYMGTMVNYTVPAGSYLSNISQQDADQQALNDVAANGQKYANANGACQQTVGFTFSDPVGAVMQVQFTGNATTYTYTVNSGVVQIPIGTYSINVFPDNNHDPYYIKLGSRTSVYSPATGFTNVSIAPGSTDLSLTISNYP